MLNILGKSQLSISNIGIGGNVFGSYVETKEAHEILHHAESLGINFIDTADVYGNNMSEEIIGKFLKHESDRSKWIIATKLGTRKGQPPEGTATPKMIVEKAERSLKTLRTDVIDLYQIHRFDPETPIEDTVQALESLVQQGKIRYYGICNFTFEQMESIIKCKANNAYFVSAQMGLNLFKRKHLPMVLPICDDNNIGVLAYGVLARGILTDKYIKGEQSPNSRANLSKSIKDDVTPFMINKVKELNEFAKSHSQSILSVALSWALHQKPVCSAILGNRNKQQLTQNFNSISLSLSKDYIRDLDNIIGSLETYDPYCLGVF